jgi:Leucine-rich repeat (LRR) protein
MISDENVLNTLKSCQNLKSITFEPGIGVDVDWQKFFPAISGSGLEKFAWKPSRCPLTIITALDTCHVHSLRELELSRLGPECLTALASSSIKNLRSCTLNMDDTATVEDITQNLTKFFHQNLGLENLILIMNEIGRCVLSFLDKMKLKSLTLNCFGFNGLPSRLLWDSILSQANNLQSLTIEKSQWYHEIRVASAKVKHMPTVAHEAICNLTNLKVLNLVTNNFATDILGIYNILSSCRNLEELIVENLWTTNMKDFEKLRELELPRLNKLKFMYFALQFGS